MIPLFIASAFAFRLTMLVISIRHERMLKAAGAKELGRFNSLVLALAHIAFYVSVSVEGVAREEAFDAIGALGVALYLVSAMMLVVVVNILGRLWTVKLIIARDHVLVEHPLFRFVRHPNYFLNILPELVGFGLALHAFDTLAIGLPVYLVPLVIRIRQEESAMHEIFPRY